MENSAVTGMGRRSSIETEPRTLNINQIQDAREAALYVVNTKSIEEALSIFTEGLQPVVSVAKNQEGTKMDPIDEICPLISELRSSRFRDIVSAPF